MVPVWALFPHSQSWPQCNPSEIPPGSSPSSRSGSQLRKAPTANLQGPINLTLFHFPCPRVTAAPCGSYLCITSLIPYYPSVLQYQFPVFLVFVKSMCHAICLTGPWLIHSLTEGTKWNWVGWENILTLPPGTGAHDLRILYHCPEMNAHAHPMFSS